MTTPCRTFLVAAFALLTAFAPLAGCSTNAASGKRQLSFLSRSEQIAIGEEAAPQLTEEYGGPVQDALVQAYIDEIGARLVKQVETDYETLPWEFTLLDSEVVNAFALPGGKVFITRGLAQRLENEAQLAGVLGHEVGHVTAEHGNKRISEGLLVTLGVSVAAAAAGESDSATVQAAVPMLVSTAGSGFLLKFGRDDELTADGLGVRYMARAGWNPHAQAQVMRILEEASAGSPRGFEFLSTHPYPETRIERINEELAARGIAADDPEYVYNADAYRQRLLNRLPPLQQ